MTGWSDVDDYGQPERRRAWRSAPESPPLQVVGEVAVPLELVESERALSEFR